MELVGSNLTPNHFCKRLSWPEEAVDTFQNYVLEVSQADGKNTLTSRSNPCKSV